MSDGNMATPSPQVSISPTEALPTEEDMGKVRQVFERGINALVDLSRLSQEVVVLQDTVKHMQDGLDKVRRQNDWLDEQLVRIRGERDTAITDANSAKQARQNDHDTIEALQRQLDTAKVELGKDGEHITSLMKERDDAQFKAMELEEELTKVRAKIEKFLSLADEIDPPEQPKQQVLQYSNPPVQVPQTFETQVGSHSIVEPIRDEPIINPVQDWHPKESWER